MPSTYTTNGGIEKIATGEQSGSWGATTNLNFDIIDRITNGVGTITLSGASSNLQTTDGTLSDGQYKALVLGGSPSGTHTITVLPNDAQKIYFVQNGTSESVIFSQGSGSNVTIPANTSDIIYCDGGGASAAVSSLIDDVDLTGYMQSANNLSDVADAATALTNLGVTSTAAELNLLDGSTAGTIANSKGVIYGASGEVNATTLQIAGTSITSTAAELNILDGVTATTAELNYNDITTLGTTEASKVATADANGVVTFDNGTITENTAITSSSGTATLNLRDGDSFSHTLTENVTYTFSNPAASGKVSMFNIKVTQDSTARTITWPSSVDWPSSEAPTLTTTSGAVDVFVFFTNDGGTTYYGFTVGQDLG